MEGPKFVFLSNITIIVDPDGKVIFKGTYDLGHLDESKTIALADIPEKRDDYSQMVFSTSNNLRIVYVSFPKQIENLSTMNRIKTFSSGENSGDARVILTLTHKRVVEGIPVKETPEEMAIIDTFGKSIIVVKKEDILQYSTVCSNLNSMTTQLLVTPQGEGPMSCNYVCLLRDIKFSIHNIVEVNDQEEATNVDKFASISSSTHECGVLVYVHCDNETGTSMKNNITIKFSNSKINMIDFPHVDIQEGDIHRTRKNYLRSYEYDERRAMADYESVPAVPLSKTIGKRDFVASHSHIPEGLSSSVVYECSGHVSYVHMINLNEMKKRADFVAILHTIEFDAYLPLNSINTFVDTGGFIGQGEMTTSVSGMSVEKEIDSRTFSSMRISESSRIMTDITKARQTKDDKEQDVRITTTDTKVVVTNTSVNSLEGIVRNVVLVLPISDDEKDQGGSLSPVGVLEDEVELSASFQLKPGSPLDLGFTEHYASVSIVIIKEINPGQSTSFVWTKEHTKPIPKKY